MAILVAQEAGAASQCRALARHAGDAAAATGGFGAYRDGVEIYARAASKVKELVVVEGASHYELYEQPGPVGTALGKLLPFFKANP